MTLYVYRFDGVVGVRNSALDDMGIRWRPSLTQWIPPGKNKKYLTYSLFHHTKVFRNRHYCWLALKSENIKASMLCVPAHFRWPFMAANDIQFTYVMTASGERGKGWGSKLIQTGIASLQSPGRAFWYITDKANLPSQKLAIRTGFSFTGTATSDSGIIKRLNLVPARNSKFSAKS